MGGPETESTVRGRNTPYTPIYPLYHGPHLYHVPNYQNLFASEQILALRINPNRIKQYIYRIVVKSIEIPKNL